MPWQGLRVVYPDIELVLCDALQALLPGQGYAGPTRVVVARSVPVVRPSRFVVVNRDGGPIIELRDRPRVRVRVWADDDATVSDLARTVDALCLSLPGSRGITHAEHLSGPLEVSEPSTQEQRYLLLEFHTRPARSLT